jgi:hypothetical protein
MSVEQRRRQLLLRHYQLQLEAARLERDISEEENRIRLKRLRLEMIRQEMNRIANEVQQLSFTRTY